MYLKIDEFNHLDDIPDYYNFQKPYLCVTTGSGNTILFSSRFSFVETLFNRPLNPPF